MIVGQWSRQAPRRDNDELDRLAKESADPITTRQGSVVVWTSSVDDVEAWRKPARRAGRILGVSIRTAVSYADLPAGIEPVRLYANCLTTFAINQVEQESSSS